MMTISIAGHLKDGKLTTAMTGVSDLMRESSKSITDAYAEASTLSQRLKEISSPFTGNNELQKAIENIGNTHRSRLCI
ncbi:hypothetical protein [Facklamia hominis]